VSVAAGRLGIAGGTGAASAGADIAITAPARGVPTVETIAAQVTTAVSMTVARRAKQGGLLMILALLCFIARPPA